MTDIPTYHVLALSGEAIAAFIRPRFLPSLKPCWAGLSLPTLT